MATIWSTDISLSEMVLAIFAIVLLLIINALLHAGESSISGLRLSRLKELLELKDPVAKKLQQMRDQSHSFFATCQVGFQVCRVGMVTASVLIAPTLSILLFGTGDKGFALVVAILIAVFLVALINLCFSELLFRGLARRNPEGWASRLYGFLRFMRFVLSPFVWIVAGVTTLFIRRFGVGPIFSPPIVTEEELVELVEASGASGELIEDEKEMITSIIEFTDTVAREVMTPRTDIDALDISATPQDFASMIEATGHTRIPVFEGTIDRIVGIIHAKDLLRTLLNGNGNGIRSIMRPPLFIPESKDLHSLLAEFRSGKHQMAIVQDEFGGTAGLVTIEDVVEEIVGDIVDEYDVEETEIKMLSEGKWEIDGKMHLDDVNDEIASNFESDEFDTLGGFVFGLFGRQPQQGEVIEFGNWRFTIAETDGRRILRVILHRLEPSEETTV